MPKVYIVNGNEQYKTMFIKEGWEVVEYFDDADLIQFTGGADVTPALYGEQVHPTTHSNTERDRYEIRLYYEALMAYKAVAGICRGGQFVHVMNGGNLVQDCDGHALQGVHEAIYFPPNDYHAKEYEVTSTHHQMMGDEGVGDVLVELNRSTYKEGCSVDGKVYRRPFKTRDIEAMHYPSTNSLSFQPHPEFPGYDDCRNLYFKLLRNHLGLGV